MQRSSWLTFGIVAVIVGLLTVFMALLYSWQIAASEAEREQLHRRAEADTKEFADEFNREIQGAYFNFQTDPTAIEQGDASETVKRFEYWQQNTAYPELIKQIIFYPKDGTPRRFDPAAKSFVDVPNEGEIASVGERLRSQGSKGPLVDDRILVVPLHPLGTKVERVMIRRSANVETQPVDLPKPAGYIAVFLDSAVVKNKILPELAASHFPDGDLNVSVTNREGESIFATGRLNGTPDANAGLYDLRPDHFIFFSNVETLPKREQHPHSEDADVIVDQRIESRTEDVSVGAQAGEKGKRVTIQLTENGPNKRTTVLSSDQASMPWQLNVQHQAGSINAFVTGERYKYFAFGIGVYLLLVGSILAIVFSSMRAKAFAQRQIDFVSSVSHEFRTPLAVIYSAGENLADGVARDGEQVSRYGDLIKGEGKKLSTMVEQVLEFAGARSGKKKYNLMSGDVTAAVHTALEDCEPVLTESGFEVESSLALELPNASIDQEAIETAVRNLIQNAVKYSNGSRWVRVATENGRGSIKIVVEDRGIGISDSEKRKIFEPFYRGKDVVDAQIHGNGLGLSLVKEIAEAHGGRVSVESESGKGSRFVIEFPC